ncbi:hypothetical protein HMN09_00319600 [Mycena chlorophos]|uniref:Uncharacterized protein n=1 Tax=Mycena chlorophos TaxID=658473 RepID=A0A8H6TJY7_MYCCL|nr:hypothetical protein HMN09_00319600 [Mycena chlorophos]
MCECSICKRSKREQLGWTGEVGQKVVQKLEIVERKVGVAGAKLDEARVKYTVDRDKKDGSKKAKDPLKEEAVAATAGPRPLDWKGPRNVDKDVDQQQPTLTEAVDADEATASSTRLLLESGVERHLRGRREQLLGRVFGKPL